ncbi:unnamed protein product [Caenorhabditis nigoni]
MPEKRSTFEQRIITYSNKDEAKSTLHGRSAGEDCADYAVQESIVSILSFGFYRRTNFMGLDANGPVY